MSTAPPHTVHSCTVCTGYPDIVQRRLDAAGQDYHRRLAGLRAAEAAGAALVPVQTHLAGATWRAADAPRATR